MNLLKTDHIQRATNVAQRLFEEQMLVITPKDSMLHKFNAVGTFIWQFLERSHSVEEIVQGVQKHFDTNDEEAVSQDVITFIEKLCEKGLVSLKSE